MPPQISPNITSISFNPDSMSSSNSTDVSTNVVFGIFAVVGSLATIWQGHKAWKLWQQHVVHNERSKLTCVVEYSIECSSSKCKGLMASNPGGEAKAIELEAPCEVTQEAPAASSEVVEPELLYDLHERTLATQGRVSPALPPTSH